MFTWNWEYYVKSKFNHSGHKIWELQTFILKFFLISRLWKELGNNNSNLVPQDKQKTMISANIQIFWKVTPHSQLISERSNQKPLCFQLKNYNDISRSCFYNCNSVHILSTIMTQQHIANIRVASRAKMKTRLDWQQLQKLVLNCQHDITKPTKEKKKLANTFQ